MRDSTRVTSPAVAGVKRPRVKFLHLWGPNARDNPTDAFLHGQWLATQGNLGGLRQEPLNSRALAAPDSEEAPFEAEFVFLPTYWGEHRKSLLGQKLLDAGIDTIFVDPVSVLLSMQRPTVQNSILLEIEPERVCISVLDFENCQVTSRMIPSAIIGDADTIVETLIAAAHQLCVDPTSGLDLIDGSAISAHTGITSYPPLWRESVEFVVAEAGQTGLGGALRGESYVGRLRRRGFLVYEFPLVDMEEFVARESHKRASNGVVEAAPVDTSVSSVTEIRRRLQTRDDGDDVGIVRPIARSRWRRKGAGKARVKARGKAIDPIRIGVGVASIVSIGAVVAGAVLLAGQRQDIDFATVKNQHGSGSEKSLSTSGKTRRGTGGVDKPSAAEPADSATASAPEGPGLEGTEVFEAAGVSSRAPRHFLMDESESDARLVLFDGDRMRLIVTASPVPTEVTLDDVLARMVTHSASDPTMSGAMRDTIGQTEVVTMLEKLPSGRSVVLWHYRIENGMQLSVGCQYRGQSVPAVRSDCDTAVVEAKPLA